jgi:putative MATE family efflux protein
MSPRRFMNAASSRAVRRQVINLAWPIVLANVLQRGVGFVDTMLVGHLGTPELAGVGIAQIIIFMAMAVLYATGVGATVVVAYHTGAGEMERRREVADSSVIMGVVLAALMGFAGHEMMEPVARWIGAEGAALEACLAYLSIVWWFFIFKGMIQVVSSIFQGAGDTRTPLIVITGVNVVHILIAYPLVFGRWGMPQLGVAGSAIAAVTSETLGALVLLRWAHWRSLISRRIAWYRHADLVRLVRIGLPVAGERLSIQLMQGVFSHMVIGFSVAAFAAHQIGIYIESISFLPGLGFMQAATALMGQNLGRGDLEMARRTSRESNRLALTLMTVLGVSYFFFPHFWVSLFSSDPEVLAYGETFCRIAAFLQPPLAVTLVYSGSLRGAGETRWVLFISMIGSWVVRIPFAWLAAFKLGGGIFWVWLAMPIDWTVRAILVYLRFRFGSLEAGKIR